MGESAENWKVLSHGKLEPLAENLWWVQGDIPNMGMKRTMVVARLASGNLVIHSAIALDEQSMLGLEKLGNPRYMVVPNGWHRMDAARYLARYPDCEVLCPKAAKKMVEKVVPVTATYDERPHLESDDESVILTHFSEKGQMEGAMMVRSEDGVTVVLCDSLFNVAHQKGAFGLVYGKLLGNFGGPKVTLISRTLMRFTGARAGYRAWLSRTADAMEPVRLVPGHGAVIQDDAAGWMRRLASSL